MSLIYVAVDEDGEVLTVNESRDDLEAFVMEYFGINPNKYYSHPDECLGFTKIQYSEFEDDLEGYWLFRSTDLVITRVNLWCKQLNETI